MFTGFLIFLATLVMLVLIKIYIVWRAKLCTSKVCLVGKTAIVTGANTGIGYETALELAKRGAKVILACRDLEKAKKAKNKIISETENKYVVVKQLNFNSLQSVRDFVKDIKKSEGKIDILINNAGSGTVEHKYSEDGLQLQMQINYFGPVLLTILLIDLLKKSAPSRIINVSSYLAQRADLTINNLNKSPSSLSKSYNNSKLANILFTIKMAELLKGTNVSVFSLHPGAIATDFFKKFTGINKIILDILKILYFKSPEQGAQTTLQTALQQNLEKYSGQHFEECARVPTYKVAQDFAFVEGIWTKTVELLKCEKEVMEYLHKI